MAISGLPVDPCGGRLTPAGLLTANAPGPAGAVAERAVRLRAVQPRTGEPIAHPMLERRFVGLDIVRVFAALTVIWHHSIRSPELLYQHMWHGTWGTSFFNFTAGFMIALSIWKKPHESLGHFAVGRFRRLYLPFLTWAAVGLIAKGLNGLVFGHQTTTRVDLHFFWHGGSYHLWFLPYVIVASLLVFVPVRFAARLQARNPRALLVIALATMTASFIGLLLCHSVAQELQGQGQPSGNIALGHLVRRFPLFSLGVGLSLAAVAAPAVITLIRRLMPAALLVAVTSIVARQVFDLAPGLFVRSGAIGAFLFGLGLDRLKEPPLLARMGRASFGVYLCHTLFVEGSVTVLRALQLAPSWQADLVVFAFSAVGSFALVLLCRRFRATAWLIP